MSAVDVSVIIPCRNERGAIVSVLERIPDGFEAIVVDNGSIDGTAEVAAECGVRVIAEPRPGYGSAVHAGVLAARRPIVCTIDGDGSMSPTELPGLVDRLRAGADLVVGRRRPTRPEAWPLHARAGSAAVAWWLRRRYGLPVNDIGPMRAIERERLLALGIEDRRSGYPVELLVRAARSGLRVSECAVTYTPRTAGRSKVSGSIAGSVQAGRDFLAALS
ncbi:glycosyltransferase family 2 protein [Gordonia hankookensis]|uniref:Glycosyltransferase family 2 protein n=1 Tax=Gordonia hankookensis TaxID=589403 RepID=A0ABR7W6V6_9ACTN|nr:glycosyltransferase family 2 protein [Gordonia hankookensis]MBD1318565.1 glycosyltransferase family 2 protein [Gordonia hankookensis]